MPPIWHYVERARFDATCLELAAFIDGSGKSCDRVEMIVRLLKAIRLSIVVSVVLTGGPSLATSPALAAPAVETSCLSASAIQDALVSGQALRLADIRHRLQGDIVRADLCRNNGKLAYLVTVLTPEGVVKRVSVDANSGEMVYLRQR